MKNIVGPCNSSLLSLESVRALSTEDRPGGNGPGSQPRPALAGLTTRWSLGHLDNH